MFLFLISLLLIPTYGQSTFTSKDPDTFEARLEQAKKILKEAPLIDTHNNLQMNLHDLLGNQINSFNFDQDLTQVEPWKSDSYSQTDLPRLRKGMISAQFWCVWVPCNDPSIKVLPLVLEQIDVVQRLIADYPDDLILAVDTEGIQEAFTEGKIASLIGMEGGHMINSSLGILRTYYSLGVRYLTLTHDCDTFWAETSFQTPNVTRTIKGLNAFGRLVVEEMNRLGMIVDLPHTSYRTMMDAIETSAAPVMFSHNVADIFCKDSRNVHQDVLEKLKTNGGVIMVNFHPVVITCSNNATIQDLIDNINAIRNITGVDHIGIGSEFNGIKHVVEGLEDVSMYPNLFAELLLDPTWTEEDLKKLSGQNFLRLFKEVEKVKANQATKKPIENDIIIL